MTTYRDSLAVCTKCGNQFIFRVEDQRRQAERGEEITPPELCTSCDPSRAQPAPSPPPRSSSRGPRTESTARSESRRPPREKPKAEDIDPGPHEGSVKWYDREKGYGFVVHPDGNEIFFHRTGIAPGETPDFPDDTRVTYMVEPSPKGPQAVDVARMDAEEEPDEIIQDAEAELDTIVQGAEEDVEEDAPEKEPDTEAKQEPPEDVEEDAPAEVEQDAPEDVQQ